MSLVHWLPLINNFQDIIGGAATSAAPNRFLPTSGAAGKLGTGYTFNNSGIRVNDVQLTDEMSFALWVKLTTHTSCHILDLRGVSGEAGYQPLYYGAGSGIQIYSSGGGSTYINYNLGTNWHHLVVTISNNIGKLYVDGSYVGEGPCGVVNQKVYATIGCRTSGTNPCPGIIQDVRIYDHALSQAEVKELSKALVVHYTFNDVLAEPTTNVSTINGWSSYTSYFVISERTKTGLKVYRPTNSTNTVLALSNSAVTGKMAAGEIWTFSCYLYIDGKPYKCTQPDMSTYKYSGINYYSNDDGYYTCTFTVGAPEAWIIHAPMFGSVGTNVMCEIDKIQFEKKDHPTPYTPTSRESMLVNEAGYSTPRTTTALQLSTITNNGSYSGYFDGQTSCIDTPVIKANMFTEDYTLSLWVYPLDSGRAVYFGDHQLSSIPTINFERNANGTFRYYHNGSPDKSFANTTTPQNAWTMLTVTYTPGTMKVYKNGALAETFSHTASITKDINGVMRIGRDKRTGSDSGAAPFYGYMSDFRFYTTCLSASDIAELYKTKAYITDKGDIEAHQFIEKTENIITEAEFAIPARSTAGNGKIELRNGVMAYGLQANTYYYAGDAESSNAIFKGKFKTNTQYYFDLFMDVDTMWYSGGSKYVPGGFIVRYTDGTTVEVTTQSTDGANGWKRVQYYSNPDKSVYGLGIYYYIGTKWYLRHDSGIYEVDKDNAQVTSKYTAETTQVAETSFETNALIHSSGNVVGREIIEL